MNQSRDAENILNPPANFRGGGGCLCTKDVEDNLIDIKDHLASPRSAERLICHGETWAPTAEKRKRCILALINCVRSILSNVGHHIFSA